MSSIKSQIHKFQNMQMSDLKRMHGHLEARQARVASTAFRNHIIEKQNVKAYSSEYDRIRAHLSDSSIPHQTRVALTARQAHLKSLGAKAVH